MHKTNKSLGFTIVELLIVIVVIAILAAIVIVALNGAQSRAQATKYQTDAAIIVKKAEAYNMVQSAYPLTSAGTDAATVTAQTAAGSSLATTLNNITEAKLPTNVTVFAVVPYATVPTYAQTLTAAKASATTTAYFVAYCATGKGMRTYYPDPSTSTVKTLDAGVCP